MNQFLHVLKFELGNYFKSKGYLLTTVIISLLLIIGILLPTFVPLSFLKDSVENQTDPSASEAVLAICDPQNLLPEELLKSAFPKAKWKTAETEQELNQLVKSDGAEAGFLITSLQEYTYVVQNHDISDQTSSLFEEVLSAVHRSSVLQEEGLGEQIPMLEELYAAPVTGHIRAIGKDGTVNFMYTYILLFFLYMLILIYGQMLAVSVVSEKNNRAIEILVTSTGANSLIFGKIIAGALASILQAGVILSCALVTYRLTPAWKGTLDFIFKIPGETVFYFILFGITGYFFYAFLFGALGSLVSRMEDVGNSVSPLSMIYVVTFLLTVFNMQNSDSLLLKVLSFLPFSSASAMFARVTLSHVPAAEILLSLLILVGSTVLAGIGGAKIYRMSTLRYGNPVRLSHALKWLGKSRKQSS